MPHAMQPDHLAEDTRVLLVHGWKCRATFDSAKVGDQLAALAQAIEPTGGVFVVAQCLVYVDGKNDLVIGLPVVSAHADVGPVEWSIDDARATERRTVDAFTPAILAALAPLLDVAPRGTPRWLIVPTGALASGYLAYGTLIDTPKPRDTKDKTLTCGGDMAQNPHAKAVRGPRLAHASDWSVEVIDLSPPRIDELRKTPGSFYAIARYD